MEQLLAYSDELFLLKIVALCAQAAFTAFLVGTDLRDKTTNRLTSYGKVGIAGIVASTVLSLAIAVVEQNRQQTQQLELATKTLRQVELANKTLISAERGVYRIGETRASIAIRLSDEVPAVKAYTTRLRDALASDEYRPCRELQGKGLRCFASRGDGQAEGVWLTPVSPLFPNLSQDKDFMTVLGGIVTEIRFTRKSPATMFSEPDYHQTQILGTLQFASNLANYEMKASDDTMTVRFDARSNTLTLFVAGLVVGKAELAKQNIISLIDLVGMFVAASIDFPHDRNCGIFEIGTTCPQKVAPLLRGIQLENLELYFDNGRQLNIPATLSVSDFERRWIYARLPVTIGDFLSKP